MKTGVLAAIVILFIALPQTTLAAIPAVYTNDNYWSSEHDRPVTFTPDAAGGFYGVTETGKYFTQVTINHSFNFKLQKFMIDEAFFYVSDRGVIKAESDLVALSIYLTSPVS